MSRPASRDVGRDEHPDLAGLELLERPLALGLRPVAVDGRGLDPVAVELRGEPSGHLLGAREDEHLVQVPRADEVRQQVALAVGVDEVGDLLDRLGRRHGGRDVHLRGSSRKAPASERISALSVARNSRFWRRAGSSARIRRMSSMKPMSSIRSASSRTRTSTWPRLTVRLPAWSSSRPGVATTISTPASRSRSCGGIGTPP